jgi:L-rhamnose mutarotase
MTRHVLAVDLRDDPAAIATYVDHHRAVWPEVLQSLRECGVEQMDIRLLGRRLVMIVEMRDGADFRRSFESRMASNPRVAEWERLMKSLQEPAPGTPSGDWWTAMEPVFSFDGNGVAAHAGQRSHTE